MKPYIVTSYALRLLPLAILSFFPQNAHSLTLDIPAEVELKAANYSNLVYEGETNDQSYLAETASLGFTVKNINLEKTLNSTMDMGISLQSYSSGASTNCVNSPQFSNAANRYPQNNGTPFINRAYVKIYDFLNKDMTATLGRQAFVLGRGLALSDDKLGFPGMLIELNSFPGSLKTDIFAFRAWDYDRMVKIGGFNVNIPTDEGLWQFYNFYDYDGVPRTVNGQSISSRTKIFYGIRYFITHDKISFDGEMAFQRGSKSLSGGGGIDYSARAMALTGEWSQKFFLLGRAKTRLTYAKSSRNSSAQADTEKTFMPTFGLRFDGFERKGLGEILGATAYDILPASGTLNGLPEGMSGMRVVNIGAEFPLKKASFLIDYTIARSVNNYSGGTKKIGNEIDLKLKYKAGENFDFTLVYATFKPEWLEPAETVKLISASLKATF